MFHNINSINESSSHNNKYNLQNNVLKRSNSISYNLDYAKKQTYNSNQMYQIFNSKKTRTDINYIKNIISKHSLSLYRHCNYNNNNYNDLCNYKTESNLIDNKNMLDKRFNNNVKNHYHKEFYSILSKRINSQSNNSLKNKKNTIFNEKINNCASNALKSILNKEKKYYMNDLLRNKSINREISNNNSSNIYCIFNDNKIKSVCKKFKYSDKIVNNVFINKNI